MQPDIALSMLTAIVECSDDAIIGQELDGTITSWNTAAERLYGYAAAEVLGQAGALLFPPAQAGELPAILARVRAGECVGGYETMGRRKDGERIDLVITVAPTRDQDGRPSGAVTIARDVTEHKWVEALQATLMTEMERQRRRLDDILASVPGVVWEAWGEPDAATQRIDFVSEYVEAMLGYRVAEWLATPNFWLSIVHPDDQARAAAEAAAIFAGGGKGISEFRWLAKDGRTLWVEAQSIVILDEAGRPIGMRGVTMDTTARKEAETEREHLLAREQAARAEAQAALAARDRFLSIAAHELRTPITILKSNTQMLRRAKAGSPLDIERLDGSLAAMERAADRLAGLTNDLVDISHIRTGRLPLRVQPVDLAALVHAVARHYAEGAAGPRRLTIEVAAPARINADADRLEQVLTNLLENAIKYSPAEGVVAVALWPENEGVRLSVRDEGIGLPPGSAEAIFQPFGRAANAARRQAPGMGLGLYICRTIVERHGGRIWAESPGEGRGTTLHLWLPTAGPPKPTGA